MGPGPRPSSNWTANWGDGDGAKARNTRPPRNQPGAGSVRADRQVTADELGVSVGSTRVSDRVLRSPVRSRGQPGSGSAHLASGPAVYRLTKALLKRPLHRAYQIEVEGIDHLPDGPAILAANHRSFMDSLFLAAVVDRPVSFVAKAEYFEARASAWLLRSMGQIPLRRGSPAGARQALAAAADVLSAGGVVGVYPEGTRSRDGRLHRGHLGPARLALTTSAPILPIGIIGAEQIQAPDRRLPRMGGRVTIRFGSPLQIAPGEPDQRRQLRDITDRLMAEVARLGDQEYVDRYAAFTRI